MLLQLENTHINDVNKLLVFARENNLKLSVVDNKENLSLPGKPLTDEQLHQLIESSRRSDLISMEHAHQLIRSSYDAG